MIKNIVFDMGNVLVRYNAEIILEEHLESEVDRKIVMEELFKSVEWIQMDRGIMEEEETEKRVCMRVPERLHEAIHTLITTWHETIPVMPDMAELIAELKGSGYRIYVLSNASKRYYKYHHLLPGYEFFDGEFISADHGMLKPEREIFQAFFSEYGLVPGECFFVDDMNSNIEAAIFAGMQGFVHRGSVAELRKALRRAGVKCSE